MRSSTLLAQTPAAFLWRTQDMSGEGKEAGGEDRALRMEKGGDKAVGGQEVSK